MPRDGAAGGRRERDLLGRPGRPRGGEPAGRDAGRGARGRRILARIRCCGSTDEAAAAERLIPFVAAYVDGVDVAARPHRRRLAAGLLKSRERRVRIDVVTLFPEMVAQAAAVGVTGRALQRGLWRLGVWNPRDFTTDNHQTVDDRPYGGGPGMVMMAEPLAQAIAAAKAAQRGDGVARAAGDPPVAGRRAADARAGAGAGAARRTQGTSCWPGATKASTSGCWRARSTRKSRSAISWCRAASCRR